MVTFAQKALRWIWMVGRVHVAEFHSRTKWIWMKLLPKPPLPCIVVCLCNHFTQSIRFDEMRWIALLLSWILFTPTQPNLKWRLYASYGYQLTDEWINRVAYLTFRIALQISLPYLLTKYDIIFVFLLQVMDDFKTGKPDSQVHSIWT